MKPKAEQPNVLEQAHGEWVAAMDNFGERRGRAADARERLSEMRSKLELLEALVEEREGEEGHALELLKQSQTNLDRAIRALGADEAWKTMDRIAKAMVPRK